MSLERLGAQHEMAVVDKSHNPEADYTMTTRDYVLRPDSVANAEAITITLPPIAEAKGRIYSILTMRDEVTAALTVTIQDNNDDSEDWIADIVLTEGGQGCVFYSDGRKWMIYPSGIRAASFTSERADATLGIYTDRVQLIMEGASAVTQAECMRVVLYSDVQLGTWANAICAVVDLMDTGYVTGLVGVICAELDMPAGAVPGGSGTYAVYEAEINCPTSYVGGGVPIAVMSINSWGAEKSQFDDIGLLFDITGVTIATTHFAQVNTAAAATHALKMRLNGVLYYVMLTDTGA